MPSQTIRAESDLPVIESSEFLDVGQGNYSSMNGLISVGERRFVRQGHVPGVIKRLYQPDVASPLEHARRSLGEAVGFGGRGNFRQKILFNLATDALEQAALRARHLRLEEIESTVGGLLAKLAVERSHNYLQELTDLNRLVASDPEILWVNFKKESEDSSDRRRGEKISRLAQLSGFYLAEYDEEHYPGVIVQTEAGQQGRLGDTARNWGLFVEVEPIRSST